MKNIIALIIGVFLMALSCEQKKDVSKELAINIPVYENALQVPVGELGVVINIDSIGFFDHNSQELGNNIKSESIEVQLEKLNSKFDIEKIIRDKSVKILDDNHYKYEMIDKISKITFPKDLITDENINQVDFNEIRKVINKDDLVIINVKSGLDYNPENKEKYIAKTYVYINILDLKKGVLKYSETIGGIKYIDENINKTTTDYLSKMVDESLNETLEIIDKKY